MISSITYTDYTEGLSGNPDVNNPARGNPGAGNTGWVAGQSSWAVLQSYVGISP